jgi:hypothetical protein
MATSNVVSLVAGNALWEALMCSLKTKTKIENRMLREDEFMGSTDIVDLGRGAIEYERIRRGGVGSLSMAQLTNIIINLQDAKKIYRRNALKKSIEGFKKTKRK